MHPKFSGIPLILSVNKLWFFKKVWCMFSMRHYSSLLEFWVYLGRYLAYQFYYSKVCFPWNLVCSPDQQCKCKFATWMMFILFIASWLCRRFAIEITYTVISWANLWHPTGLMCHKRFRKTDSRKHLLISRIQMQIKLHIWSCFSVCPKLFVQSFKQGSLKRLFDLGHFIW